MKQLDGKLKKRFEYLVVFLVAFIFTGALSVSMELTFHNYKVVSFDTLLPTIFLFLFVLTWARPSSLLNNVLIFLGLALTIFVFLLFYRDVSRDIMFVLIERRYSFFIGTPLLIASLLLLIKILIYKKVKC